MTDRVGEIWQYLTTHEIVFVDTPPQLVEVSSDPREIVLHAGVTLHPGYSGAIAGGCKKWYERSNRVWGTHASHMRRVA